MLHRRNLLSQTAALMALIAGPAAAAEIQVRLSGTSFEGGPAFELTLAGQVVGTGTVQTPTAEGQLFQFEAADALLAQNGDLSVVLTNDHFGGDGQDRSLFVLEAQIGSSVLSPADFILVSNGEPLKRELNPGVQIWSATEVAVAPPPPGGWLGPDAAESTSAPAQEAGPTSCSAAGDLVDFAPGAATAPFSTEGMAGVLEQARTGACLVTITGYADRNGSPLVNRRITAARAASVLDYLLVNGAVFSSTEVVPTEGTDEFGPDLAANRKVAVQLRSPPVASSAAPPQGEADQVLTMGWQGDGAPYLRSGYTDPKAALWLLEQARHSLLQGAPIQSLP